MPPQLMSASGNGVSAPPSAGGRGIVTRTGLLTGVVMR